MPGIFFVGYLLSIAVFQTTFNRYLNIDQLFPDILFVLTVYAGLEWGKTKGLKWGIFIGLLQDSISYGYLGMQTFVNALTGFSCGFLREHFVYESTAVRWTLVLIFSLLNGLIFYGLTRAVLQVDLSPGFLNRFLVQLFLNVLVTTPVMAFTTFLRQKVDSRNKIGYQKHETFRLER